MGRPTKYSQELADKICDEISNSSKGLPAICKKLKISPSTVFKWIVEKPAFSEQYTRAREAQADFLADEILEISDKSDKDAEPFVGVNRIHRAKLQIETRKWIASKLKPKKYGDKIDVTSGGEKLEPTIIKWGGKEIEV